MKLGPGTLYGAFSTLEKEGLIAKDHEEERRKYYALTPKGRAVLAAQIHRLEIMVRNGADTLGRLIAGGKQGGSMDTQRMRKFRWFWPWQDQGEEDWLTEMSQAGWHLQSMAQLKRQRSISY